MKWKIFVIVLIAVLLLSGCAYVKEALALERKPGETEAEHEARKLAAEARMAAITNTLLGIFGVLWPAGLGGLGVGVVLLRKYRPILRMLKVVVGAIEEGAPGETAKEPVKLAVKALHNEALNKIVYDETH